MGSNDAELEKRDARIRRLEGELAALRSRLEDLQIDLEDRSKWSFDTVDRLLQTIAVRIDPEGSATGLKAQATPTTGSSAHRETYMAMLATAVGSDPSDYVPLTETDDAIQPAPVRLIAFYLPQVYPAAGHDECRGRAFTDWTKVSRAVPQFNGHYQPHLPGELGFYDLRVPEVQRRQVELARRHGVSGFCFHDCLFPGKRPLEHPVARFMSDPALDLPFCLCWANENWNHQLDSDASVITGIEAVLRHKNYLCIDGRPILVVYHPLLLPEPAATAERWREHCVKAGVANPYLIAAQVFDRVNPVEIGFDAAVEFPPHLAGRNPPAAITKSLPLVNRQYTGAVYRYADLMRLATAEAAEDYQLFKTVCPGWDNEPRRPGRGSTYAFSSPALYARWLEAACRSTLANPDPAKHLVFINAWNGWGDGAHLEPDRRDGYAYLQATRNVLQSLGH